MKRRKLSEVLHRAFRSARQRRLIEAAFDDKYKGMMAADAAVDVPDDLSADEAGVQAMCTMIQAAVGEGDWDKAHEILKTFEKLLADQDDEEDEEEATDDESEFGFEADRLPGRESRRPRVRVNILTEQRKTGERPSKEQLQERRQALVARFRGGQDAPAMPAALTESRRDKRALSGTEQAFYEAKGAITGFDRALHGIYR
jgi:hypothetical protein